MMYYLKIWNMLERSTQCLLQVVSLLGTCVTPYGTRNWKAGMFTPIDCLRWLFFLCSILSVYAFGKVKQCEK